MNISIKHPGSVLVPFRSLIYINNMPQAITIYGELLLYAKINRAKVCFSKIKQYSQVTYLRRVLNECLTGESMAMMIFTK